MNEQSIWVFLFGMLSVYPFFPLRHVPVMDRLKIPFSRLMVYATMIMLIQGISYMILAQSYPFGETILAWHRKLFMIPYVLLTLRFSKDSVGKTLFLDFMMVGIVMAVIDLSYVLDRTLLKDFFALGPYRCDVLIRGGLTLLIYPPLYYLFKKSLRPIMELQSMKLWWYMTAIPFCFAIISIITTMEAFGHEISPIILSIRFFIIVGSFLVCILLGKVIRQMEEANRIQEKSKETERLLAFQGAQYESLTKNIEQTRAVRHDIRHQLTYISRMIEQHEYAKLHDFVERYQKSLPNEREVVLCENYAANSVMSHYIALANEAGIKKVDIKCALGNQSGIEDLDLCVLLGNLLENAIEGCVSLPENQREIRLRINICVGELFITADNTFDGWVKIENGDYLSRKREGKQKGIGLSSIEAVVKKYDGELRCEQKEQWFMVSARLMGKHEIGA